MILTNFSNEGPPNRAQEQLESFGVHWDDVVQALVVFDDKWSRFDSRNPENENI
jgi:hypothetical protein